MSKGAEGVATVLVCTFNDEHTIADALDSALSQTASSQSYRVLVVDDGSTDVTAEVLGTFGDRIDVVRLARNGGLVPACNEGLARIGTPYFVRLDGDDRLEPDLIESLLHAAAAGADAVVTDRFEEYADGRRTVIDVGDPPRVRDLVASGSLLPTRLVRELGGYRELFWEEYDLYLRLLESGRCAIARIPRPLYVYRVGRETQMTGDQAAVEAGWRQLAEHWAPEVLQRYGLRPMSKNGAGAAAVAGAAALQGAA